MELEIEGPGRWVEAAQVELGEGATADLRRGLMFPVTGDGAVVGAVWVGSATASLPAKGAEETLRVSVPEVPAPADGRWALGVELVVVVGVGPNVAAAAALGQPILDDPKNVVLRDADGRELVVVTDLNPRRALDDARDALRQRARLWTDVGLDPLAMLAREQWRQGSPRTLAELRPVPDLRPLVGAADRQADIVPPWLTWVADPGGLVDAAYAGVLGVHGPTVDGRVWRALGGTPHHGPPDWAVDRGVVNVTVVRDTGTTQQGDVTAQLTVTAGAGGRLIDVWVPEQPTVQPGMLTTDQRVEVGAGRADGTAFGVVDVPFGPRRRKDAKLHTWLLPAAVAPGSQVTFQVYWTEAWDVGGAFEGPPFVAWAWMGPKKDEPQAGIGQTSLGKVAVGLDVFPRSATGPEDYECELRAATNVVGWKVAVPAGATSVEVDHGTLWIWRGRRPAPVAVGRFDVLTSPARPGLPAIRVERHTPMQEEILVNIRGVLNFYADAFGPWPWPEVVVVQGRNKPVLLSDHLEWVRPEADPRWVVPGFRHLGGGMLEYVRLLPLGDPQYNAPLDPVPPPNRKKNRVDMRGRSGHNTRTLALALAEGFWGPVTFPAEEVWLAGAIPRLYRDEFVVEAWGRAIAARWDQVTDEYVAAKEDTSNDAAPLAGRAEPWAAERGGRLLRLVQGRIGEEATFRALDGLRTGPAEQWNLRGLVAALAAESKVDFAGLFEVFAVSGVHPKVTAVLGSEGALTVTTEPPVGGFELPVQIGRELRWVPMVGGEGHLEGVGGEVVVDPDGWLPLRRTIEREAPKKRRRPSPEVRPAETQSTIE